MESKNGDAMNTTDREARFAAWNASDEGKAAEDAWVAVEAAYDAAVDATRAARIAYCAARDAHLAKAAAPETP